MNFFFTGGTGLIGNILVTHLLDQGQEVTLLVLPGRKVKSTHPHLTIIEANPQTPGSWQERAAAHQVIVNLAGTSIFRRWSNRVKRAIWDSRILTTRNIVAALAAGTGKDKDFFSASGVGYYGYHDQPCLEDSPPGGSFLADLALNWEREALKARAVCRRVVLCRFGIVLAKGGGALQRSLPIFKGYLGGRWGSGEQWFSWIHERDVLKSFLFLLDHREVDGPVNLTAPNPVQNRELVTAFKKKLGKGSVIKAIPRPVIQGLLGQFSEVFLQGQRAVPRKLLQHGYHFQFPTLEEGLEDLLSR